MSSSLPAVNSLNSIEIVLTTQQAKRQEALISISDHASCQSQAALSIARVFFYKISSVLEQVKACQQLERCSGPALSSVLENTGKFIRHIPSIFVSDEEGNIYEVFKIGPSHPYFDPKNVYVEIEQSHQVTKKSATSIFFFLAILICAVDALRSLNLFSSSLKNARSKMNDLSHADQRDISSAIPKSTLLLRRNGEGSLTESEISLVKIKRLQESYNTLVSCVMTVFLNTIELSVLFSQKCWNITQSTDQDKLGCKSRGCIGRPFVDLTEESSFKLPQIFAVASLAVAIGLTFLSIKRFASDFYTARQERQKLSFEEDELLSKNFKPLFLLKMTKSGEKKEF